MIDILKEIEKDFESKSEYDLGELTKVSFEYFVKEVLKEFPDLTLVSYDYYEKIRNGYNDYDYEYYRNYLFINIDRLFNGTFEKIQKTKYGYNIKLYGSYGGNNNSEVNRLKMQAEMLLNDYIHKSNSIIYEDLETISIYKNKNFALQGLIKKYDEKTLMKICIKALKKREEENNRFYEEELKSYKLLKIKLLNGANLSKSDIEQLVLLLSEKEVVLKRGLR